MAPTPGPILETPNPIGNENSDGGGYLVSPRNNSLTVTNTKGLLNMPGQNNCFLNSAVQVLWHLDIFRRSFRELSGHACMAESCIFCALKELFTQFQYSQESALPPDALRHALARTFCDQRRFQLGFMDDAAECFENILLRIHVHIANQEHEDMCGDLQCIPHQKFAMTIVEQPMCTKCGTSSEPLPFTQMVHYVTTSALCSKALELHKQGVTVPNSFGALLQLAGDVGEMRKCSSNCGSKIHVKKTLMNHPEIVSIGLVWDSECSSAQHITDVFHCIGMCLRLKDMFHTMYDVEWGETTYHELVGVVTYYGKHYSTFFFHTKLRVWIYFDDAAVREIGPSWDSVVEKCQKGRFQPLLLLFANPNGTSLTPSTGSQEMPMHHGTCNSSSKLANMKHAIIQKYLTLQNKMPNDFARANYKDFREWSNNYEHQYQRHDIQAYQSSIPNLQNSMRSQMVMPNNKTCNSNVPIYSNASAIGIPIPTSNYANTNHPNSLPNHIYSNIHISNFQGHNHSESLPHTQTAGKPNEVCLPPLHNTSKYSSRGNAPPYIENPEMLQYKHQDMADLTKDSDSAFTEEDPENETYISRKTVENVLNLQRHMTLSRSYSHTSVGNRNSSSSLESFDNVHCAKLNNNTMVSDTANFPRRRDSGNWSGDRNSSSSSTTAENPFLTVFAAKRLMLGLNNCHTSVGKGQLPDYANPNTSDHGYDSYSVSSSDSYPSITNSPVKLDPRLTQIPEDWTGQEYSDNLDSKLKMVTEECGPPDCDKLCAEADLLLAKSHEKEKEGDLVMAALLSDSAAARARAAMDAPYNNSRSLVSAKMKHSTCVMRSSCLYRRLKDNEADERRKAKGHHSRQSSRDSTHSRHSRQGSKDNTHTKQGVKETGNQVFEDLENFGKNIEIYGTLPKKGNKKKTSMTTLNSKAKDDQVYKDFLDKQRKNTNIGNLPSEHKNSKTTNHPESTKVKPNEKSPKSGSAETVPKPPQRKSGIVLKEDPKQSGLPKKGKQKQPIEQSYFALFSPHDGDGANDADLTGRDLLSPLNSPDKKQHRIKRKLMGGFMKRKNRSLPDLRADEELSDDFERSIDDAAISGSSTLTLPNGTLKKLENLADASVSNVSRGFHQPHYAFVKKDLTQRPLLMKVNPPHVQCPPLTVPVPKQTHMLPSLPKKLIESKSRNDIHFSSDKPSKIPFMASLTKSENPVHLHPLKSDAKSTPSYAPQKMSSIPVLSSPPLPSPIKSDIPKDSSSETAITNNLVPNDDLPLPSNSFLAEIQAKRKQIIDTKDNSLPKKEIKPTKPLQPIANKGLPSHLPKLAPTGNNEGTSWLKELQTKQLQMKHKQSDAIPVLPQPEVVIPEISKEKVLKSLSNSVPKTTAAITAPGTTSSTPEATQVKSAITSSYHPPDSPNYLGERNSDKKTPGSVKDLASKFEKILTKPKESSSLPVSEPNSESVKSPSTPKLVRQQNVIESKCDQTENKNFTLPDEDKKSEHYHSETPKPSPPSEQRQAHVPPASTSVQRPQQPPDYETAMQRLELIRTNASAVSSNLQQNSSETDNRFPSVARQSVSDPPKKKSGPKKTVTFSDEVVLVACAEFDESGFFSNPLLERVYQKHIESGGTEISHFSGVSNHKTNDSSDVNNHNHQPVPTGQIGRYDNITGDSSELIPCHLCHNKYIASGSTYCTDCAFYMSRFQP